LAMRHAAARLGQADGAGVVVAHLANLGDGSGHAAAHQGRAASPSAL